MRKSEEISNPNSCLNKSADDEPLFVLRAQDALAAETVRQWAAKAEAEGVRAEKVAGARALADEMEAWPNRKMPA